MFSPTSRHSCWKTAVEPVKWMPARSGSASATSETGVAVAGHHVDDAGRQAGLLEQRHEQVRGELLASAPASRPRCCPSAPGAVGRLPAIAVKLNGVIA